MQSKLRRPKSRAAKKAYMRVRHVDDFLVVGSSYSVLTVLGVVCLIPFFLVIACSLTDELALIQHGYKLIPPKLSTYAYEVIIETGIVTRAYGVTIFITVVGTALSMIVTSGIAYAISIPSLKYRNHISFFVYFTMLFHAGLVPTYLLIAKYLQMKNTLWVMIIPALVNPWNMFLLRNFFKTVPHELPESAKMDGATEMQILSRIVIPVSLPAMATISLFYALSYWNEWFRAMLFIDEEKLYPLQYLIMRIIRNIQFVDQIATEAGIDTSSFIPDYSARMATAVLTIGPIIFVYPFVQRYFVKGLLVGSIKG
jgi:multiple sugar transport system permease protein/putative aldouronate transport system permease protein